MGEHTVNHKWQVVYFVHSVEEYGNDNILETVTCIPFSFCSPVAEGGRASGSTACAESGASG